MTSQLGFIPRMAWRDSRSSRRRLLLFSISISLGVAALIAIGLFRASLSQAIDDQARSLLGADLVVESSRPFTAEQEQMLRSLGETQAREVRFRTMALFPKSGGTRLISVRALGGNFPFYGQMETAPPSAAQTFRNGGEAVPEESLLFQFAARAGEKLKIGEATFTIAGALNQDAGRSVAGRELCPARLHSAAKPRTDQPAQAGQPRALPEFREICAGRRGRNRGGKISARKSRRPASNTTPSPSGKRILVKRSTIFTGFSIWSASFLFSSARSAWRARSRRISSRKCGPQQSCAAWGRPAARPSRSIFCRRWPWGSSASSPGPVLA